MHQARTKTKHSLVMKVILIDQHHGRTKTVVLRGWLKGVLSFCILGAPFALGYFGFQLSISHNGDYVSPESAQKWDRQLKNQELSLAEIKEKSQQHIEALTIRLASLQARLSRLDAMGLRVTHIAGLDEGEFDFENPVGVGGLGDDQQTSYSLFELGIEIERLERTLGDRESQLKVLGDIVLDREIESDLFVAGKPLKDGWIVSSFGQRPDPFTGKLAFHSGIDLTNGRPGSEIDTVAAGVVVWSGPKSKYGLTVEVDHGKGFTTRYSHAEKLFVNVGDIVKKGQSIASVGSTGRSTGPHVHFEIYKNGRVVDPASYINRTDR